MSDDWQVGDKLVRVKNRCRCEKRMARNTMGITAGSVEGQIYEVTGFSAHLCPSGSGVILAGLRNHDLYGRIVGSCRGGYRKIRPDEHAPCEEEFVTLLNRAKRSVSA